MAPTQQNRAVYTVIWPYVEIAAAQVKGDLPALIEQKAYNQTDKVTAGSHFTGLDSRRCLCGVRSVSRGDNFRAYLNLGGSQNPAGITVAVDDALGDTTLPVLNWTPTDRSVYYDATAAGGAVGTPARRYYMNFSSAIVDEFYGTYRAFLRYMLLTAPVNGYLCMTSGDQYDPDHIRTWVSSSFTLSNASLLPNNLQVADLGKIEIGAPGALRTTDILNYVRFYLYLDSSTGLGQCYFTDLILLPIDEMSWDVQLKEPGASDTDGHVGSYVDYERYFDCDSIGYPKFQGRAWVRQAYTDQWVRALEAIVNGPFSLHSNRQQRMWFLFGNNAYSNGPYYPHEICHKVQLWHTPRYLGLRGDR